jgi:hypothetical protein
MSLPPSFGKVVGPLPQAGRIPEEHRLPYETVQPVREGYVERNGVKSWYAVWGESGPWIAFAPIFQITHSQILKATVPYLSQHFRVVTMDGRGNGRSDRPQGQEAYRPAEGYARAFVRASWGCGLASCRYPGEASERDCRKKTISRCIAGSTGTA